MIVLGLLLCEARTASAEPDPGVRETVDRARRHFDLGEYDEAIEGFREAYRADPRPALLYNLAQALRLDGDCVQAASLYRSFLRHDPDSSMRTLAEQHLAQVTSCAESPTHSEPQRSIEGANRVAKLATTRDADLVARDGSSAGEGARLRLAGVVTGAVGVVALGMGAYFSWDASRAADRVSDGYRDGASWAELDAIDARGRRSEITGGVLLAAGAAATATGAVLYVLGWREQQAALRPRGDGAEVVVSWQF